jgi:hypothetical protein
MTAYAAAAADPGLVHVTARDNVLLWDHHQTGHYEVWYVTFNHPATRTGFWIRYTIEAPISGAAYAQLWFAFFDGKDPSKTFGVNQRFPITDLADAAAPFRIAIGGAELGHDHAKGAIAGDGHTARWDITWLPAPSTHHHLPEIAYRPSFPATTRVVSPNLDVPIRGTVVVDGRTYTFEGAPGGQTHLWGKKHAHAWAWGHCNAFEGRRGAALEILSVQLKRRGLVTPPMTLVTLYLDGETFKLTEFQHTLVNRGSFGTGRFAFRARGTDVKIAGEFRCRPDDMVLTEYHDPDGEASFCANTEVADLDLTVHRRSSLLGRWAEQARLSAAQSGHFEVAGRAPDPAIAHKHVRL